MEITNRKVLDIMNQTHVTFKLSQTRSRTSLAATDHAIGIYLSTHHTDDTMETAIKANLTQVLSCSSLRLPGAEARGTCDLNVISRVRDSQKR